MDSFRFKRHFSFLDYLRGGLELQLMVAVDLTRSNLGQTNPKSMPRGTNVPMLLCVAVGGTWWNCHTIVPTKVESHGNKKDWERERERGWSTFSWCPLALLGHHLMHPIRIIGCPNLVEIAMPWSTEGTIEVHDSPSTAISWLKKSWKTRLSWFDDAIVVSSSHHQNRHGENLCQVSSLAK